MYRVLFAEDELLVRLGLKNAIRWSDYDMEVVGEADNGITALELFEELRPDVLITDIKMGGMDGYELIKRVRDIDGSCAVVIISCLDDFETLRRMMGYCIIGYILKASMTLEEIGDVLNRTRQYLVNVRRQQNVQEENKEEKRENVLRNYLCSVTGPEENIRWMSDWGFPLENLRTLIILSLREADEKKINELGMKLVRQLLCQSFPEAVCVQTGSTELTVICTVEGEAAEEQLLKFDNAVNNLLDVTFGKKKMRLSREHSVWESYQALRQEKEVVWEEDPLMEKAVRFMEDNHGKQITLQEITDYLCISTSYFSSQFKKNTGKSFVEYLNDIRLEKVLGELRYSREKIAYIAERHGFRNQEYFTRFFKKKMGISPVKWRQQHFGKDGGSRI